MREMGPGSGRVGLGVWCGSRVCASCKNKDLLAVQLSRHSQGYLQLTMI